jgi:hypothetical protein
MVDEDVEMGVVRERREGWHKGREKGRKWMNGKNNKEKEGFVVWLFF